MPAVVEGRLGGSETLKMIGCVYSSVVFGSQNKTAEIRQHRACVRACVRVDGVHVWLFVKPLSPPCEREAPCYTEQLPLVQ
jgi:hypothetical protein